MSASKPGAKEIAERTVAEVKENYGYCCKGGGTNLAIGPETLAEIITDCISEALEARERNVQELCKAAENFLDDRPFSIRHSDLGRGLRTALAKLRAGEQKGTG